MTSQRARILRDIANAQPTPWDITNLQQYILDWIDARLADAEHDYEAATSLQGTARADGQLSILLHTRAFIEGLTPHA